MQDSPTPEPRWRQSLRFDGLWWRRLAYLGSVYGPDWWKRYSPPFFAAAIFAIVGRNRRGAVANQRHVLGRVGSGVVHLAALRMFSEFSHCMTETIEFYGPRPQPVRIDVPEPNELARALQEGKGAVVVTGHFGNWDIAAKGLKDFGRPINIVMASDINQTTTEYVRQARASAGVQVIYSDSSVFSTFNMIRALRRNEVVAIQLDRSLSAGGLQPVPFFDAPALFPTGPFVLARVAAAPVIPIFVPRLGVRHYEIRVGQGFHVSHEAGSLERAMGDVVNELEGVIRQFPTQWFQFSPFWPEGSGEPGMVAAATGAAIDDSRATDRRA